MLADKASRTKKNKSRTTIANQKNKVEDHSRKVKSSLNKMNSVSELVSNTLVKHSVRNAKFESICAICNKCLFDVNHDMCIMDYVNDVNNTLVEYMILSGADNRPPILDKDLYDSWKSIMELYMQNGEHERMILELVEHDPLIWPTVEENGLVKDLHTTNFDQLHAYLKQHELHANEIRLLREHNPDPLAFVANQQMTPLHFNTYQSSYNNPQLQHGLAIPVFSPGVDPVACLNKAMTFLIAVASSRFPSTNNQLITFLNPRNQATIQDGTVTVQQVQGRQGQNPGVPNGQVVQTIIPNNAAFQTEDLDTYDSDCDDISNAKAILMANISNYDSDDRRLSNKEDYAGNLPWYNRCNFYHTGKCAEKCGNCKLRGHQARDCRIPVSRAKQRSVVSGKKAEVTCYGCGVHMLTKPQVFYDNIHKQALGYQNPFYLKKAQRIKPTLYDGIVISAKHVAMPVIDDEETLILEEESRSKMSEKEKDPEAIKQNISHKPIDYEKLNRLSDDFGKRFTPQQELSAEQAFWLRMSNPTSKPSDASPVKIEAPKELPKVSLVNESLKKLKFHLARFDNVVKIRTTPDARTEVFDQMDAAVQQSSVDKQCLEIAKKELLLENDRLLQQIMSQDVLLTMMNSTSLNGQSVNMERKRNESCDKCFNLDAEILKSQNAHNGKEIVNIAAQIPSANTIVPRMFKLDLEPFAPRLLQNREAHIDYLKYTQEQADILQGIELLVYVRDTCPNSIKLRAKKVVVTPKNNVKKVRFAEPLISSSNIKVESSKSLDSNTYVLSSYSGLRLTSNWDQRPTGNKG
ncbi:hypothetical protein Tco_1252808 [Tanacetum coccineum]